MEKHYLAQERPLYFYEQMLNLHLSCNFSISKVCEIGKRGVTLPAKINTWGTAPKNFSKNTYQIYEKEGQHADEGGVSGDEHPMGHQPLCLCLGHY